MSRSLPISFLLAVLLHSLAVASEWVTLEGCRLVRSSINDGDSFKVRHQGKDYVFRIFFVDAPETDTHYPDRVKAQANYFSITFDEALQVGEEGTIFARNFLSGSFTVHTDWSDGWGGMKRYRAIIEKDGKDLSLALVENGLARVSGFIPDSPWPGWNRSVREFRRQLAKAEKTAQRNRVGAWRLSHRNNGSSQETTEKSDNTDTALELIEINQAGVQKLQELPGIGPVLSQRIIENRPYRDLTELVLVRGISTRILENLLPYVYLEPPPLYPYTAEYYRTNVRYYIDTEVRVQILELKPSNNHAPEGFGVMEAITAYGNEYGGKILLYAPTDKMENAQLRFENNTEPRTVYAWLRDFEGEAILIVP